MPLCPHMITGFRSGGKQEQSMRPLAGPSFNAAAPASAVAAATAGDEKALQLGLAAGADPNALDDCGAPLLLRAVDAESAACVRVLLAAGADPNAATPRGLTPLHWAASLGSTGCAEVLLASGASPGALTHTRHSTSLHHAVLRGRAAVLPQLLAAAPAAALVRDDSGNTPLDLALQFRRAEAAHCLLGPLLPSGELLAKLHSSNTLPSTLKGPLYAAVAARQRLDADQWALVPASCPSLGAALPAVLARSVEEAALPVSRMAAADKLCLQQTGLCLAHAQRQADTPVPTPIVWRLLALSAG